MQSEISFSGDFTVVSLQKLRPGGWYVGFLCPACGQRFAIMEDPTDSGAINFSGAARFNAICPNCEDRRAYDVSDLTLFQSAQGGPSSTA
jgi:hypothetical protein